MSNIPIMLTVEEARTRYRLSKQFLYLLAKSGKVKAVRAGVKILINADSLNNFLCNSILMDEQPATMGGIRQLK